MKRRSWVAVQVILTVGMAGERLLCVGCLAELADLADEWGQLAGG